VVDVAKSSQACTDSCESVRAEVLSAAENGGEECPDRYYCTRGDGACSDTYVDYQPFGAGTCETAGMEPILDRAACASAWKAVQGRSDTPYVTIQSFDSHRPYGCHFWAETDAAPGSTGVYINTNKADSIECSLLMFNTICYCETKTKSPTYAPTYSSPTYAPTLPAPTFAPTKTPPKKMMFTFKLVDMTEAQVNAQEDAIR